MTGVVYFIFEASGIFYFIVVPRSEIREIQAHRTELVVYTQGDRQGQRRDLPYDPGGGSGEYDDIMNLASAWDSDLQIPDEPPQKPIPNIRERMIDALTQSVDTDVTFRWVGTTWEIDEGRPR